MYTYCFCHDVMPIHIYITIYLYIHISIYLYIYIYIYIDIYLYRYLSICVFVCLSVRLSVCMCQSVCLSVCMHLCMFIYLPTYLSAAIFDLFCYIHALNIMCNQMYIYIYRNHIPDPLRRSLSDRLFQLWTEATMPRSIIFVLKQN